MKIRDLPHFTIPESLERVIDWGLQREGLAKTQPQKLAAAILALSQRYQESGSKADIWDSPAHRAAYWCYFLPLNFIRLEVVAREALRCGFWQGAQELVDFGSGVGTSQLVLGSLPLEHENLRMTAIEVSHIARRLHEEWLKEFSSPLKTQLKMGSSLIAPPSAKAIALFSYSLNELGTPPPQLFQYDRVLIVEPSTGQAGRRLMELRQTLLDKGFHCWAPCTHELACPLLSLSKTDWCHDRILMERPSWMMKVEQHLPLDNRSLTFSYLLAARDPHPQTAGLARIIGDTQIEKGKVRQAVCRNANREFLAWLKKQTRHPLIARGSLVAIPESVALKGNEIRPEGDLEVISSHGR